MEGRGGGSHPVPGTEQVLTTHLSNRQWMVWGHWGEVQGRRGDCVTLDLQPTAGCGVPGKTPWTACGTRGCRVGPRSPAWGRLDPWASQRLPPGATAGCSSEHPPCERGGSGGEEPHTHLAASLPHPAPLLGSSQWGGGLTGSAAEGCSQRCAQWAPGRRPHSAGRRL